MHIDPTGNIVIIDIAFQLNLTNYTYRHRKHATSIFKSMNIPGPEPHWFFGNVNDLDVMVSVHIRSCKTTLYIIVKLFKCALLNSL